MSTPPVSILPFFPFLPAVFFFFVGFFFVLCLSQAQKAGGHLEVRVWVSAAWGAGVLWGARWLCAAAAGFCPCRRRGEAVGWAPSASCKNVTFPACFDLCIFLHHSALLLKGCDLAALKGCGKAFLKAENTQGCPNQSNDQTCGGCDLSLWDNPVAGKNFQGRLMWSAGLCPAF